MADRTSICKRAAAAAEDLRRRASATWRCAALLEQEAVAAAGRRIRWRPKPPHFPARAKRIIFLFMKGGPVARRYVRPQAAARRATTASRRRSS